MLRRKTSKRFSQNIDLGVGNLDQVPYLFDAAKCGGKGCSQEFYLGSRPLCQCSERHKFKAQTCYVNGTFFGSLKEGRRYSKLAYLEHARIITDLETQPTYTLTVNGAKICKVKFDFGYRDRGTFVLEDTKGAMTPLGKFKLNLFEVLNPTLKVVIL